MYKILTAIAVVAVAALGTTIIATVLLRSSISRQSRQISSLQSAEHSDQQKIAGLEGEVGNKQKKLTAVRHRCTRLPEPMAQPDLVLAAPRLLLAIRDESPIRVASIRLDSESSRPGDCG